MTQKVIDREAIEQLFMFDEDGDDSFSREMLTTFENQGRDTLVRMRSALRTGDYDDLSRAGHFLKGSSVTMGSIEVPSICADIEHAPRTISKRHFVQIGEAMTRYFQEVKKTR